MGDLKEFEALTRCFGQNPQAISVFQDFMFQTQKPYVSVLNLAE
jgi:hypothetical protein